LGRGRAFTTGNRLVDQVVGGFRLSGLFTQQSGAPMSIYLGSFTGNSSNVCGYFTSTLLGPNQPFGNGACAIQDIFVRPDLVPNVPLINSGWKNDPLYTPYINSAAFTVPGSQGNPQFGNVPRTMPYLRTPSPQLFDMSLRKEIHWGRESRRLVELRADAVNALNHRVLIFGTLSGRRSLYSGFNVNRGFLTSAGFGDLEATDAVKGRTFRLGARLSF
jgi:hypothetical protein